MEHKLTQNMTRVRRVSEECPGGGDTNTGGVPALVTVTRAGPVETRVTVPLVLVWITMATPGHHLRHSAPALTTCWTRRKWRKIISS